MAKAPVKAVNANLQNATFAGVWVRSITVGGNGDGSMMRYELAIVSNSGQEYGAFPEIATSSSNAQIVTAINDTVKATILDIEGTTLNNSQIKIFTPPQ